MSATLSNATSNGGSVLGATRGPSVATGGSALMPNLSSSAALFREIHKNTWLKRLTADGKRITVGPKKSERSWVVFCVHDDSQALLEGYAEPRQAASHNPEWVVSMQETQHISHALIPNSHEFEFVVTLSTEVVRFHTTSWEVMQEWVETLRSKLREMKILSPRENLYTKLPEIRAPLLPTRDPTSPLPAPPPVPAALVPGIERVVPQGVVHAADATAANSGTSSGGTGTVSTSNVSTSGSASVATSQSALNLPTAFASHIPNTPAVSSMSNTLTQNLLNMLSDPIIAYSEQLQEEDLAEATHLSDVETNSELSSGCNLNVTPSDTCMAIMQDFSDEMPAVNENSVRLDIGTTSPDQSGKFSEFMHCGRLGSRPQTSRSFSAGAADSAQRQLTKKPTIAQHLSTGARSAANGNITELEIISAHCGTTANTETSLTDSVDPSAPTDTATNITIIQVTNDAGNQPQSRNCLSKADVFKFPEEADITSIAPHNTKAEDFFRSNVQIIPSSVNSSTIRVIDGSKAFAAVVANQYSAPTKNPPQTSHSVPADSHAIVSTAIPSPRSHLENHQITTVHVGNATMPSGVASLYGTCYTATEGPQQAASAPILPNKIILSANSSGVTNISVNSTEDNSESVLLNRSTADSNVRHIADSFRYEKVFLSSSIPVSASQRRSEETMAVEAKVPMSPKLSLPQQIAESAKLSKSNSTTASSSSLPSSPTSAAALLALAVRRQKPSYKPTKQTPEKNSSHSQSETGSSSQRVKATLRLDSSPVLQRKHTLNALVAPGPSIPTRAKFLTRGLTEAVITARPSRKDLCSPRSSVKPKVENNSSDNRTAATNNNEEATTSTSNSYETPQFDARNRTRSGSLEQRKRSSSTSETQAHRTRATNNNELTSRAGSSAMRMQPPPHPISQPSVSAAPAATKRLTLREQQVMQLRREIMHPGGVRLQLRRKDCIGSIAWVDAFGAVWVAGWKQKEHPVLYNALHIGDQLVSIAGVTVSSAADANKVIRNSNTLFIEVLIRRIPFGRGYAIRREREGQCLGLIRDGNTSTIVDVVPNSLAARHGLPPKAQSCDGSTLTFWVLTEINARPLNLFFKENEIRDRLNSVGRDISILVQPSDLIVKLKKQLKSMRGYKDYLVQ